MPMAASVLFNPPLTYPTAPSIPRLGHDVGTNQRRFDAKDQFARSNHSNIQAVSNISR
jgi:hypothetical protein